MQNIPHSSAIGSLMYAQVCTRPDLTFIVGMLSRYLSKPRMDNWIAVKRVMRYLQGTKDYMLVYRRSENLEVIGYSDSDLGGCIDIKSTSGYVFMLAGGAISWKSANQSLIAQSTMEVEFIACYKETNHAIGLRNFVTGLRVVDGIERPLKVYCDNRSATEFSNNNESSEASKHINIKYLVVIESAKSNSIH
ncbi:secreted RxLR effector protein 161-like [Apium graveolens]|uniref:secreted RxLR effector protein 161-like n=1 Tax=Apium graveolens TaxID=4045 RepID=UPI003D7A1171